MPRYFKNMKDIVQLIEEQVALGLQTLYDARVDHHQINLTPTRKEFEGDFTLVVFPFTRLAKQKPEELAEALGNYLQEKLAEIVGFNVIKGFLNLEVDGAYWRAFLADIFEKEDYGKLPPTGQKVLVEYSSPNTNKPLHLGHVRNILLGWSVSCILEAAGNEVVRVQVINDRGIAICKSMLAWQKFSGGATPESTGTKSDHFVGGYYVLFQKKYEEEYTAWQTTDTAIATFEKLAKKEESAKDFFKRYKNTYFNEHSELGRQAKDMLLAWEAGDPETVALWKKMNLWVYDGYDVTYERMGVSFDKLYYESETYLLGKEAIEEGLEKDIFYRKEDGSVWIDLEDAKLDHKLVLRSNGTSVYMTQDIGTAQLRYQDFGVDRMVYTVADEQNYHFQVLFEILQRLEEPYADGLYHLSYGMVDLPSGRMKSREGTVVDADDLMEEVIKEARKQAAERGTLDALKAEEREEVIRKVAMAALKYFIVRVNPKKRMTFNPAESVDMQGQTGPYIQNAYVRIQSVLRKAGTFDASNAVEHEFLDPIERDLTAQLYAFPDIIRQAAEEYDPSHLANYCFDLAKSFHRFYHDFQILKAETEAARAFRLQLSTAIANTLKTGMGLLGIEMPDRM